MDFVVVGSDRLFDVERDLFADRYIRCRGVDGRVDLGGVDKGVFDCAASALLAALASVLDARLLSAFAAVVVAVLF